MNEKAEPLTRPVRRWSRRQVLGWGSVAAAGLGLGGVELWRRRREGGHAAQVFIGRAQSYRVDLTVIILDGLKSLGVTRAEVRGKRILLKPNLVETAPGQSHINTHPAVVAAAAEVFRRLDAGDVFVAEGQGHRRDSWLVLDESGMRAALKEAGLRFVDLNHDEVVRLENAGTHTGLEHLYLPRTLVGADWVVSMPKLKTHHWAGMTCAMKNLFGVMPGMVYGWPKNVLHWEGVHESILDVNATTPTALAIVDGIVGMEGDGPIMGTPKQVGCLVMGRNPAAVDATCARVAGLKPLRIPYLAGASGYLGPIREGNIEQRGEQIAAVRTCFSLIDVPHLKGIGGA
jgi:uncharacterized protein (DUF362 family)